MNTSRKWITCFTLALAVVFLIPPAGPQAQGQSPQLTITGVQPDVVNEQLTVVGENFGARPGSVWLAGLELTPILGWSNTQIIVPLPAYPLGTYLLTVARGRSVRDFNVLAVTLGAAGAKGDKGDKGDPGVQGEPGNPGAQGEKGDKGDQGIQGIQGTQGIQGIQGNPGNPGGQGIQGPPGPQGPAGLLASYDQLAGLPCTSATGFPSSVLLVGPTRSPACASVSANGRFRDLGQVILDTQTNLMWEKKDQSGGLHDVDNLYTWCQFTGNNAGFCGGNPTSWIGQVNAEAFAGFSNWRIPNQNELMAILDMTAGPPRIDPIFGPTQASLYWGTEFDFSRGWYVNFVGDTFPRIDNKGVQLYVRAVRAAP